MEPCRLAKAAEKDEACSNCPGGQVPAGMNAGASALGAVAKLLTICGILPTSRSRSAGMMATEGYAIFTATTDAAGVDDREVAMFPPPSVSPGPVPQTARTPAVGHEDRGPGLRAAARDLETAFLTEMLRAAGTGRTVEGFGGGGVGEDQFASFLVEAQAEAIMKRGGLGLSEILFQALLRRESGA